LASPSKYCRQTILQLASQGLSDLQVAILTGCSKTHARTTRVSANIRPNSRNQPWTKQEDADLTRFVIDGDRRRDMALFFNRTLSEVGTRIRRLVLTHKHNYYHARLRVYDLVWLMDERGYKTKSIAIRLHFHTASVRRIVKMRPKYV